jgi:FkbM family methyltransferase
MSLSSILKKLGLKQEASADPIGVWRDIIEPGDLVFDVGANLGAKAALFLECGARVVCFEPQPHCADKLRERFTGNSSVTIVQKGVADAEGELELSICSEQDYISTFSPEWKQGRFKTSTWDKTVRVPVTTLDKAIAEHGCPTYCKIDVEGFELPVLQGLSAKPAYLSFEFAVEFLEPARQCLVRLNQLGYRAFNFTPAETQQFHFKTWVSSAELFKHLSTSPDPYLWGDIYARESLKEDTLKRLDSTSGTLWREGQKPKSADDLLLRLKGVDTAKQVRVIYQIGAHRHEEEALLREIFPSLELTVLFEPNPELFEALQKRFAGNSKVQVFPYALSDRNGEVGFFLSNNDGHSSSLLPFGAHRDIFPKVHFEKTITVQTRKLSAVMREANLPAPDFLFIDAQGAEFSILSGVDLPDLQQVKIIYLEASLEEVYKGSLTLDELRLLLDKDFVFGGYAPQSVEFPTHGNALFLHRGIVSAS